jgi:predicted RND superfamily exporter protein
MWKRLGEFVINNRLSLLAALLLATLFMGFFGSKVKLSYEFAKAIPTDNPKYQEYKQFRERFGDDGNLLVVGVETNRIFELATFKAYAGLQAAIKKVEDVDDVLSIPSAVSLEKDPLTEKLNAVLIFPDSISTQASLDSARSVFFNLPFYRTLLYNADSNAYLMGVHVNKEALNSPKRSRIVSGIVAEVDRFEKSTGITTHVSGLPLIRTAVADRVQKEMKIFLLGSLVLSALILLLFFRSVGTMLLSLSVVILGVIWSLGVLQLCGYKINLLTALTPPLVVVIGIPNCIYFINKYHSSFIECGDKRRSLVDMVSKMGVVTLFCNISAAIGFAVFALTRSAILKEFGVVAGISIMLIFVISFILLPTVLSYLPAPGTSETRYLNNKMVTAFLQRIEAWVMSHQKNVYLFTGLVLVISIVGIFKLDTVAYIVDDLPKTDKIYTDLKFFERNFKGVMPLEIVVDTKKRNGLVRGLAVFEKMDSLAQYIGSQKDMNRPLSIIEGLKFAKQAFNEGDSAHYLLPNSFDVAFVGEYLRPGRKDSTNKNNLAKMLMSFMDSSRQITRMSVSMADVGSKRLPLILDGVRERVNSLFDSTKYKVQLTGTSITFLEGSNFIISG